MVNDQEPSGRLPVHRGNNLELGGPKGVKEKEEPEKTSLSVTGDLQNDQTSAAGKETNKWCEKLKKLAGKKNQRRWKAVTHGKEGSRCGQRRGNLQVTKAT